MKYGFSMVMGGRDATPDTFTAMAARAEALELDSLWFSSHVVIPPQVKSGFALVPGRMHPPHWHEGYWEPFTVLSFLAAQTTRITLGTSVTVLPMHNPFEVARHVAEVDQLSRGRFIFGIGVGWFEEEFEVVGQSFSNRGARADDAIRLMKRLWADDPVSYEGRFYSCENVSFGPKPVQRPHPPLWVAGGSPAAIRRAAQFGDAFHPVEASPEGVVETRTELDIQCEKFGRAPGSVEIGVKLPLTFRDGPGGFPTEGTPGQIADGIQRYTEAGVTHFTFDYVPEKVDVALDVMERFAQEVRPRLG
ncbi:MAG: LLM class F420-dependent oxidoreductase [Immundisolibacterales bacterium]|nr:LLM class F420-dependent oxidoreductase [Immundisolibacterales bacterium]